MHEGLSFSDIFDDDVPYEQKPPQMLKPMEEADWPIQAKDLFKGLWETELLNETHLTDLFHATNTHNLLGMLEDNAVKLTFAGGTESDQSYNRGYSFFLATMRAKYGNYARGREPSKEYIGMYNVVVHLDGDALKTAGFKMFPVNYWGGDSSHSEQEERIVSDKDELKPMANFIKDVHVYIPKDLKHAFVINDIHKINELAPSRNIKVYFYPPNEKDAFRMQRTERAITDVNQILQPAVFSAEDLEHMQWRSDFKKKYGESKPNKLEALLRIAKGDYSNIKNYPDKSVLEMLLFHWYDVYPSLMADVHNFRKQHLPIFREVVTAMKKEGVKTFKEFINKVMIREQERYNKERGKLEESDTLELNNREYDYENQYALSVFEVYDTFWIYSHTKNKLSKLHSDNKKLQDELIKIDDQGLVNSHTHMWTILDNLKTKDVNIPNINYNKGKKKSRISGRVWGVQGKIYVTFWESQQNVKIKLRDVEEIIRDMGFIPEKSLYVFNGKSDAEVAISYDELKNTVSVSGSEEESGSKLRRLIHLNPRIKKAMLNVGPDKLQAYADSLGMPLVKLKQIMGSLDEVQTALSPNKHEIGWSEAFAIFIIYPNNMVCVMQETPSKMIYFSNIPEMQDLLNRPVFQKFCPAGDVRYYQLTHYRFNQIVNSCYQKYTKNIYSENLDCRGVVAGRIWRFENGICNVGIWQNVSNLKQNWELVKWTFDVLNVNPNTTYYTFKDKWKKQFTFDQIMGKKKIDVKNPDLELSKLKHFSPQVKRSILKLPVDKLQNYADRLNIPLIKLKQMLGSMDEIQSIKNIFLEALNKDQLKSVSLFLNVTEEELKNWIDLVDNTPTKSFGVWLLRGLKKKDFRFEDNVKINDALMKFIPLKISNLIPDIMSFPTIHDLEVKLEQLSGQGSKRQGYSGINPINLPGVEVIEKRGNITFFKVTNPRSLAKMGEGTKWCTRESYPNCKATEYIKRSQYLIMVYKDNKPFIQYNPDFSEIKDVNDQEVKNISSKILLPKPDKESSSENLFGWHKLYPSEDKSELKNLIPFRYELQNNQIILTKYFGFDINFVIPHKITNIGNYAFDKCTNLTSITIPNSVTSIGNGAFRRCTSLTNVTIPNSVTFIGVQAFSQCFSLTNVTIPASVTSIGEWAFSSCTNLTIITIPNSVTSIGFGAFEGCTSLTSITIPNSVTNIGDWAFVGCTNLTSVTIPNSVTSIGDYAFRYCTRLTSITIPDSVTSIGDWAFGYCTNLTSVTIPNSVTSIGDYAFRYCTRLTSITIPDSVTSIGFGAFEGCTRLMGVYFQGNAPSLGERVFSNTGNATAYYLPGTTGWKRKIGSIPTKMLNL